MNLSPSGRYQRRAKLVEHDQYEKKKRPRYSKKPDEFKAPAAPCQVSDLAFSKGQEEKNQGTIFFKGKTGQTFRIGTEGQNDLSNISKNRLSLHRGFASRRTYGPGMFSGAVSSSMVSRLPIHKPISPPKTFMHQLDTAENLEKFDHHHMSKFDKENIPPPPSSPLAKQDCQTFGKNQTNSAKKRMTKKELKLYYESIENLHKIYAKASFCDLVNQFMFNFL